LPRFFERKLDWLRQVPQEIIIKYVKFIFLYTYQRKRMKLLYAIFALLGFTSPVFGQQYTSNLNLTYEENAVITVGSQVINLNDTYYVNSAALDPAYINTNDYVQYPSLITANGHHIEIIGLNDSSGTYLASTIIFEKVIEVCILL
ncbi:hypothetical protein AM593_08946, partial [Mytilus galloprovincialis]